MFQSFVLAASVAVCSAHLTKSQIAVRLLDADEPRLPNVDSILSNSSGMVHDFARAAAEMQVKVEQHQERSHSYLAEQKKTFETMLMVQENQSRGVEGHIKNLELGNQRISETGKELEANVTMLQSNNAKLREALEALGNKMSTATMFVEESSRLTDDADAEDLKVLRSTTRPPTVDTFLAAVETQASLLQLPEPEAPAEPAEIADALANSISEIQADEANAAHKLQQLFEVSYNDGYRTQAILNATVAKLVARKSELNARNAELFAAKDQLEHTGCALRKRLTALHSFAEQLDLDTGRSLHEVDEPARSNANSTNRSVSVNHTGATASNSFSREPLTNITVVSVASPASLRRPGAPASMQDWFVR